MKLPFKKEDFLGNVRSGNKRENNSPRNLSYFDVHLDNYTSEYSVALFKSVTQENPSQLEIMPIDNIIVTNEIYTKNFKCKGYLGKATRIIGNEGKQECTCNEENCKYFMEGKCVKVGRLYFRLKGALDKGIWCYSTKSRGIKYIENYLNLMIEKGIDITKSYFLLQLNAKTGKSGKVYVPDIKLIDSNENKTPKNTQNAKQNPPQKPSQNQNSKSQNTNKNLFQYIGGKMIVYNNQKIPQLVLQNPKKEKTIVHMNQASKKDLLKLNKGTVIEITKLSKDKNNTIFLTDYNILRAVPRKEGNIENKKAV